MSTPRQRKFRHFKDKLASVVIAVGGLGVIAAVLLIFLYLLYEVKPLFDSAEAEQIAEYQLSLDDSSPSLHLAVEERGQVAMRLGSSGLAVFLDTLTGEVIDEIQVPVPVDEQVVSFSLDTEVSRVFALGFSNGDVLLARYDYQISYTGAENTRIVRPVMEFPFGETPFELLESQPVEHLAVRTSGESFLMAGSGSDGQIELLNGAKTAGFMSAFAPPGDAPDLEISRASAGRNPSVIENLHLDFSQRWLFILETNSNLKMVDLRNAFGTGSATKPDAGTVVAPVAIPGIELPIEDEVRLLEPDSELSGMTFLLGGNSLLVANDDGEVSQWFPVRTEEGFKLRNVRSFDAGGSSVAALIPEQRRKNFVTLNHQGYLGIYNTTAHSRVFFERVLPAAGNSTFRPVLALAPRGDALLIERAPGDFAVWTIENEHPEVSWSALWNKVWYENHREPEYIWQSSAANNDFEPKYSLVPLSFGTLKAAFYAMLLAAPLAICGAVFTGYFMAPAMRRKVKPLIELMEALPTVVLGFLAGLWLAPFVEDNLSGVFALLVMLPLSVLLAALLWLKLPKRLRESVPDGWEAALLVPVIILATTLSFALSGPAENLLFGGNLRFWINNELGITYDQRNALIVGFAMGFAVIPTIFSIAEDAIFTVPRHLSYGSLALGATPWQSLTGVVLPTASPGIFSGLMIGFGRAVGETMIVLMATGNTPIMDINIFEGMRTLAANIAVEVPEAEVASTHYRILFLAAFVLFLFTFVVNTVAEIVRQRLRNKYSTV